ncbi:Glutathione S-transferase Mu 4 [Chamberlinius hualienensis]
MPSTLAYWKVRGYAQPIRLLLTYVGEEFEEKLYVTGPAPDYDKSTWFNEKFNLNLDFPNLPYYVDDKYRISQSSTILRYIGRKYNLAGSTEDERVRAELVEAQLYDYRAKYVETVYSGDKFEEYKATYPAVLTDALKSLSDFLGDRKFFAGDNLTFVDFLAYEYLYQNRKFQPAVFDSFDNIKQFLQRFEALPRVAEYIKTAPASKYALNNKMAGFANTE